MDHDKIVAPKPVYKSHGTISKFNAQKPVKRRNIFKSNNNEIWSIQREKILKNLLILESNEDNLFHFERDLNKELCESFVKDEIFSIFNKSTRINSNYTINIKLYDSFDDRNIRARIPPLRSENPFYKNFDFSENM